MARRIADLSGDRRGLYGFIVADMRNFVGCEEDQL